MPVSIARPTSSTPFASLRERRIQRGVIRDRGRRLRIDLVNNMPDAATLATQRQFIRLIEEGARDFDVTLGLMTLDSIPRSAEARREMAELYRSVSMFGSDPADAVIVTGAEPRAAELDEEPYWRELTALFDLASRRSYATLASCLAAHALVLHRDRVRRQRAARKVSGLFVCEIVSSHPIVAGLTRGLTPHSRWNGLEAAELEARGYLVLARSADAGVDIFARDGEHLTLCFQGHPEYDGDTLAREYRRDVSRALNGGTPPDIPSGYYSPSTEARLGARVAGMMSGAEAPNLPRWAMVGAEPTWRARGAIVINNWLQAISARKLRSNETATWRARSGG